MKSQIDDEMSNFDWILVWMKEPKKNNKIFSSLAGSWSQTNISSVNQLMTIAVESKAEIVIKGPIELVCFLSFLFC